MTSPRVLLFSITATLCSFIFALMTIANQASSSATPIVGGDPGLQHCHRCRPGDPPRRPHRLDGRLGASRQPLTRRAPGVIGRHGTSRPSLHEAPRSANCRAGPRGARSALG